MPNWGCSLPAPGRSQAPQSSGDGTTHEPMTSVIYRAGSAFTSSSSGGQGSESKGGRAAEGLPVWGGAGGHGHWVGPRLLEGEQQGGDGEGPGGTMACGPRRGCLTQPWEPAGAQVPSQGRGGDGTRPGSRQEGACPGKLAGAEGPQGPRAQQLRGRPSRARVPQEGHLPAACQRVTGAGLEFASGPTQVIE